MTESPRLRYAKEVVAQDPLAVHFGIRLEEAEVGHVVMSLLPEERHMNAVGRVHGSAVYALAEQALAVAANTLPRPALVYECKINFLAGSLLGEKLTAEARPLSRGRVLCLWEVRVTGVGDELKAVAQGVTYHLKPEKPVDHET